MRFHCNFGEQIQTIPFIWAALPQTHIQIHKAIDFRKFVFLLLLFSGWIGAACKRTLPNSCIMFTKPFRSLSIIVLKKCTKESDETETKYKYFKYIYRLHSWVVKEDAHHRKKHIQQQNYEQIKKMNNERGSYKHIHFSYLYFFSTHNTNFRAKAQRLFFVCVLFLSLLSFSMVSHIFSFD